MKAPPAPECGFRSKLDKDLTDLLSPLRKHKAAIGFPFFANTFPLAFHYACLLKRDGQENEINDRIKLIAWGKEREFLSDPANHPLLCYTTEKEMEGFMPVPFLVPVTAFQPRYIFSEYNLRIRAIANPPTKIGELPKTNFNDLARTLVDGETFEFFEIFTEIPLQASALFSQIFGQFVIGPNSYKVVEASEAKWVFDETHLSKNTLRLFLYGAPLTTYFSRKLQRFIAFKVKLDGAESYFETAVAVIGQNPAKIEIAHAIREYHRRLYARAKAESGQQGGESFRAVQYHYNRVARLLQHRSSFVSSREYAKCLYDHHKAPRMNAARQM